MSYQMCRRCNKMFKKDGRFYCEDCLHRTHEEQTIVVDFVRQHPNSTIIDIISETGVTLKAIECLVEEGYVSYVKNENGEINASQIVNIVDKLVDKKTKFYTGEKHKK